VLDNGGVSSVIDGVEIETSVEGVIDGGGGSVVEAGVRARPRPLTVCEDAMRMITNTKFYF
jgi:hypothetical protein